MCCGRIAIEDVVAYWSYRHCGSQDFGGGVFHGFLLSYNFVGGGLMQGRTLTPKGQLSQEFLGLSRCIVRSSI